MIKITRSEFEKKTGNNHYQPYAEQLLNLFDIEIIDDPVPLRLECYVTWDHEGCVTFPYGDLGNLVGEKLKPFIGKRTRMILEEIV